jgi:hypothetical protein
MPERVESVLWLHDRIAVLVLLLGVGRNHPNLELEGIKAATRDVRMVLDISCPVRENEP